MGGGVDLRDDRPSAKTLRLKDVRSRFGAMVVAKGTLSKQLHGPPSPQVLGQQQCRVGFDSLSLRAASLSSPTLTCVSCTSPVLACPPHGPHSKTKLEECNSKHIPLLSQNTRRRTFSSRGPDN